MNTSTYYLRKKNVADPRAEFSKVINNSGIDIYNPLRKIFIKPIAFILNKEQQSFKPLATSASALMFADKIRKGETLDTSIQRILREEFHTNGSYLGAKVDSAVEFDRDRDNILTPRLFVCIYIEEPHDKEIIKQKSQRSWVSIDEAQKKVA